jgi:hypothetical protein
MATLIWPRLPRPGEGHPADLVPGPTRTAGDSRRREELAAHGRQQWVKDTTILTNLRRSPVNRRLFIAGTAVVALVVVAVLLATALGGGGGGGY